MSRSSISVLGRIALSISELANKHGLYLGRRSGRIHAAIYLRTGGRLIQIGAVTRPVRARLATDEERVRLWPRFVEFYPGYDLFERISYRRRIPIVILEPR